MRALKIILLGVLGSVLLVVLALGLLLGTEGGSRWALGLVPGLEVSGFQGRLGGSWQASALSWSDADNRVEVQAPQLNWSPACLLRATLCIEQLQAERIDMAFAPSDQPAESGPLQLPVLRLPVAIELGEVKLGKLRLDGSDLLGDLHLAAHWTASGLRIDGLQLQRDDLQLSLQGDLQPEGDWPVQLRGRCNCPRCRGRPGNWH